jgi:hypothetical protein
MQAAADDHGIVTGFEWPLFTPEGFVFTEHDHAFRGRFPKASLSDVAPLSSGLARGIADVTSSVLNPSMDESMIICRPGRKFLNIDYK